MKSLLFVITLFSAVSAQGQKTQLSFGLIRASNEALSSSIANSYHYGYRVGVDQRILGRGIYILGGMHYQRLSSTPLVEKDHFGHPEALHLVKSRLGLGLTPFSLTRFVKLRLKAMGSFSYMAKGRSFLDFSDAKSHFTGLDLGIGVTLGILTIDLEYEKGLSGILRTQESSRFNIWALTAGVEF